MKIKSNLSKITLMIITTIMVLFTSKNVFGYTVNNPTPEPYQYNQELFCVDNLKGWRVTDVPGMDTSSLINVYEESEVDLEKSIGYALYTASKMGNYDPESLQKIVWASGQFNKEKGYNKTLAGYAGHTTNAGSTDVLEARSNQFAQFYYGILQGKDNFQITTDSKDAKVLVDQDIGKYTVGPYRVDLKCDNLTEATSKAKEILGNELTGTNELAYPNAPVFAQSSISGIEGTEIEFIDKAGNSIKFPGWGEDFYIRFKPDSKGVITIRPKIVIEYIPGIEEKVKYYQGSESTFTGSITNILVRESNFRAQNYVSAGAIKQNGDPNSRVGVEIVEVSRSTTQIQEMDGYEPIDKNDPSKGNKPKYKSVTYVTGFTYKAKLSDPLRLQELIKVTEIADPEKKTIEAELGTKQIYLELGGNVWVDLPDVKTGSITGVRANEDAPYMGMEVMLYEIQEDGSEKEVAKTVTNKDGRYHFIYLSPLKKYFVRFRYNGQIYQQTYYKNQLSGGYSTAVDIAREEFNAKFGKIDSTAKNYKVGNEWHKSYPLYAKLQKDNGEYITINSGEEIQGKTTNKGVLTYADAWNKFELLSLEQGSYDKAYIELEKWLAGYGVGNVDKSGVITFIKDCMITSTTHTKDPLQNNKVVEYPVYNQFIVEDIDNPTDKVETITLDKTYSYLYTKPSDQSRYVDFGINRREQEELFLQKDVFKATVVVNGKRHDYEYSKKNLEDDGSWSIEVRAADALYNGDYSYTREVRRSEYLYVGDDSEIQGVKNLNVYVTYRLAIKNRSQTLSASINEIVDYYDAKQYTFDGELTQNGTYSKKSYNLYDDARNIKGSYVNSYVGSDAKGTRLEGEDLTISTNTSFEDREKKTLSNGTYSYDSLYLTGIKSASGNDRLLPGEFAYVYVTFKVNKDPATGKVMLDQDIMTGNESIGKRNIAEINGYSTYYRDGGVVPGYLQANNTAVDTSVSNKVAGIIDTLSNAGNLSEEDLSEEGDLKISEDPLENRTEMDTDKAPNIKIVISQNDEDTRKMTGYVYEDDRTANVDKAVVGNGVYDEGENKINGVKVELVELVSDVDQDGTFMGTYKGEKVWGSRTYKLEDGKLVTDGEDDFSRYYSGIGKSKVILSGPGILKVSADTLEGGNGEYSFKSVPAGDFFIRFTYGDSSQTVLTNGDNEVNSLIGAKGLNAKSYNGQDYKSTTYQKDIAQDISYNGINGYTNYDVQNYTNASDKSAMYFYDIVNSAKVSGASDAKDVYGYRESVNNWSKGAENGILLNNRAEILNSFESIGTYKYYLEDEAKSLEAQKEYQISKINTLIKNTTMVAQTGVIDTEIEYNSTKTTGQGSGNRLSYIISDIDLGLEQRPVAQLKLNKEITNFKLALVNNQIVFDTTQTVNNLYFSKHDGHSATYNGYRLNGYTLGRNTKEQPELLQAYLDEELIAGSSIQATYKITAENVGEVDYLDKQFYYTGKSARPDDTTNMSTTNARAIIDYVSNLIKFDSKAQETEEDWLVMNLNDILQSVVTDENGKVVIDNTKIDKDLVNRYYLPEISTYNTIVASNKLSKDLLPTLAGKDDSSASTTLVLSTLLSNASGLDDFVYNNLSEIVATTNTQGRRMQYSVSGNQEMADQSLGSNASTEAYSSLDLVTPKEIDADSAQKIVVLPPLGENKNFTTIIVTIIASLVIATVGIIVTKKFMK